MRTVKQLPNDIAKETDLAKFPDSTVVNETDSNPGTPVIREIYGDVLTNIYKLLRITKTVASGNEDNEVNGYQVIDALKKFSNSMNDVEQQLSLSGTVFSVNLDLSILPNKYILFAKAVEAYNPAVTYTFKGVLPASYPFTAVSTFASGDVVMLVIDTAGVRAYNMISAGSAISASNDVFTTFGTPLAFNNSDVVYYQEEGILFNDAPQSYDLQAAIRVFASDGTLLVYEMLLINGYVYCLVLKPSGAVYKIYRFAVGSFSTPTLCTGLGFNSGIDNKPNIYTNGTSLFLTNSRNGTTADYYINIFSIDDATGNFTSSAVINLDVTFEKTTNAVVIGGFIYTYVGGVLTKYNLSTGVKTVVGTYVGNIGVLFYFKNSAYYSSGEVAKAWAF